LTEGLSGVTQRIAQINRQIAALAPPPVRPSTTTAKPQSGGTPFDAALAQAMAPSSAAAKPAMTKDGVPVDLVKYGNGKIPPAALSSIGRGDHRLWAPAAGAFQQLTAAAAREGVTIGVTDSYRSFDQQVDLARRKGLYSQGGLAAKPGTSDHGWGLSLDLDLNPKAQAWMRRNAAAFGFAENVPREPWHWTYSP
jgi:D-alanyl-D-alanine carboxypeptidase